MATEVLNKINITAEAVFDYEEALGLGRLDRNAVKAEAGDYIDLMNASGRLLYGRYFRCKYFDENSGRMLMLFLYRAERWSVMQVWDLAGICFASDWTEDAEDDGEVRRWLKAKITDLEKGDWVIEQQARAFADRLIGSDCYEASLSELPKEVRDAFKYGKSADIAQAISYFANANKERFGR